MAYGSNFLQGTTGQTYAAGWRIASSGVVDGGTVVKGGNVASDSPMTNSLGVNTLADDFGTSFGSKVVAQADTGDKAGVDKAVTAGTLAYQAGATEWVMRGGNVTSTLGGVSNDILVSPARDTGDLNDFATEAARTKINDRLVGSKADEAFDIYARPSTAIVPGRTKGTDAGVVSTMVNPEDGTAAVATEIAPSLLVPGELTYHFGALAKPTTDEYVAKNVYES